MNDSAFHTRADGLLGGVSARLEAALDGADVDLQGGVLSIALDDGRTWLLNKHAPTQQLWLSSPVSGARHYAWDGATWADTRGGVDLPTVLAGELAEATGRGLDLAGA